MTNSQLPLIFPWFFRRGLSPRITKGERVLGPPWTYPSLHIEHFALVTSSSTSAAPSSSLPECDKASLELIVQQIKTVDS